MALRAVIPALLAYAIATPGIAAKIDADTLADLGTATIATIGEDGTMTLSDGRGLRLAAIELARNASGYDPRQEIADIVGAGPVTLKGDGPAEDRYGRVVAQVFTADGVWVEGELLRRGWARVATTPDHHSVAPALYTAERTARAHRIGLWSDSRTALRHADAVVRFVDSWQVVDGIVVAVAPRHNAIDLHLGDDETRDLSIRIPTYIAQAMPTDPSTLTGRHLRVRGWIGKGVGPLITINHAEQIEIVGRPRRQAAGE
jgi:endonuclease YncB( thermonuclease family)